MTFKEYHEVRRAAIDAYWALDDQGFAETEARRANLKEEYDRCMKELSQKTGIAEEVFRKNLEAFHAAGGYEAMKSGKEMFDWLHKSGVAEVPKPASGLEDFRP